MKKGEGGVKNCFKLRDVIYGRPLRRFSNKSETDIERARTPGKTFKTEIARTPGKTSAPLIYF